MKYGKIIDGKLFTMSCENSRMVEDTGYLPLEYTNSIPTIGKFEMVDYEYELQENVILITYYKKMSVEKIQNEIKFLKLKLSESDYKVVKLYEYYLVHSTTPYDFSAIHLERLAIRDEINRLEAMIS